MPLLRLRIAPLVATVLALWLLVPGTGPAAAAQTVDLDEAAIRQLRKATVFRPDGLHHAILLALRDLRDPAMKPLFQALVQASHWSVQLDAILGLAELEADGQVDPWLLAKLRSEQDRADAIRVALELELLGQSAIEKLLDDEDLQSVARVVLLAEQRRLGGTPDAAALQRLARNADPAIAGMASCILAQMGDGQALKAFADTIQALPAAQRDEVVENLANAAMRYELPVAIDLLAFRVDGAEEAPGPQETVVGLALKLDPRRGLELWRKAYAAASQGGRSELAAHAVKVRYGLILLINAARLPPEAFDQLVAGADAKDALLAAMAKAGKAVASGRDTAPALIELYEIGHRRSARWVLSAAEDLDTATASAVYEHVIDRLDEPARRSAETVSDAVVASARLIERNPESLMQRLASAEDDGLKQEAILLGLASTRAAAAGQAAATVRRIGAGRPDSLALLVMARHGASLGPDDVRQLGTIAAGGGRLDETLQAQAAWLYLRHSGQLDKALPKVVGAS